MKTFVAVCGITASGNRVLARSLTKFGIGSGVYHGDDIGIRYIREAKAKHGNGIAAIIPVRSIVWRRASIIKRRGADYDESTDDEFPPFTLNDEILTNRILEVLVELKIPVRAISYEAFVENPTEHLYILLHWLGSKIPLVQVRKICPASSFFDSNEQYRGNTDFNRIITGWKNV